MHLALQHTQTNPSLFSRIFSLLVKVRLVTNYPHGGIVEDGMLRQCNFAKGLHEVPFNPEGWHVFEVPDLVPGGDQLFEALKGTPYDSFSLLAFLLPWRVRDSKRLYCFEWAWLRMTGQSPNFRVTPEALLALAATMNRNAVFHR